ncbi:hypothetical protein [Novosphingobium cyanobacteriorum]|uniref:Uncharacterized protein n=1 Tax=Novosphingobium cyanobacteriorum TaxID=3024215 RepID=A0ABT6CH74_9SPHN|nr:hypothetical protein [Novosphingobium cyanobacteriorum]MDF8332869.1 hypothetical protein [Novosphingobium cyanobacteriorum]
MIQALRPVVLPVLPLAEIVRTGIVLACALSLIMAGRAFPF